MGIHYRNLPDLHSAFHVASNLRGEGWRGGGDVRGCSGEVEGEEEGEGRRGGGGREEENRGKEEGHR